MRLGWLTLALLTAPALAGAQTMDTGGDMKDQGTNNRQSIERPAGDRSVVQQTAGPGSDGNTQSVTVSSPGDPPNRATQHTQGAGNTQSIVVSGGSGNVVVQGAEGGGGTQTARGSGHGSTIVQTQRGLNNRQTVVQTGTGNVAIQRQRGNGLNGALQQHGGQTDVQVQQTGRPE